MAEDEKKKPGGGGTDDDIGIAKEQRDPDEMVFAEQAIHHYVEDVLEMFRDAAEAAMSQVSNFLSSSADAAALDNQIVLEQMGGLYVDEMAMIFGGAGSPIAQALCPILQNEVDESARQCNAGLFAGQLSRGARDASWFLRDNLQSILSNEWDQLRDLAYEGSTDFIPMLHQLGLPEMGIDANKIASPLIDQMSKVLEGLPKKHEVAVEAPTAAAAQEEKKEQEEEMAQAIMEEDKETKEVA